METERCPCSICGTPCVIRRRVTRTTQVCPHSADRRHRDTRRQRREATEIARLERYVETGEYR